MGLFDSLFGESPSIKFKQSPQQSQVWDTAFPAFQNFMQGNFPPLYDVPSPVGPTEGWYNNIAPAVRQSLWEPAMEGGQQLLELMGARGQTGSAGSPYSGSAATGLGKLFSDYSQGIGGQAWGMMQPGLMADYQAQLGRNMTGYQTSLMPFQTAAGMLPGTYANPIVNPGSQGLLGSAMQMMAPWAMSFLPWGNFGGQMGGGSAYPFGTTLGGQYANF